MTDTITESFCERCGTRYSFDRTAKPRRGGIGRVRVLTRGLKNYVANDGIPMNEAMAAARDDEGQARVSRQLDAFRKAFNLCMSCRQYTCANCWNELAGECLTCAPELAHEAPPSPTPGPAAIVPAEAADRVPGGDIVAATAWPTADLARTAANLVAAPTPDVDLATDAGPAPAVDPATDAGLAVEEPDVLARLEAHRAERSGADFATDAGPAPAVDPATDAGLAVEEPDVLARKEAYGAERSGAGADELTVDELAEVESALAAALAAVEQPAEIGVEPAPAAPEAVLSVVESTAEARNAEPKVADEPLVAEAVDGATPARGQARGFLARFRSRRRPVPPAAAESAIDRAGTAAEAQIVPVVGQEAAAEAPELPVVAEPVEAIEFAPDFAEPAAEEAPELPVAAEAVRPEFASRLRGGARRRRSRGRRVGARGGARASGRRRAGSRRPRARSRSAARASGRRRAGRGH